MKTKFYRFDQNNSGGDFIINEDVCENVFVEAYNAKQANALAESCGIYFDGCIKGEDCHCCGDRWYRTYEEKSREQPELYSLKLDRYVNIREYKKEMFDTKAIVYYIDGRKETFVFKE